MPAIRDIYTGEAIRTPSEEHILLNALGGRFVSKDLIDKTTNDQFGDGIDAALGESIATIRTMLNARSGDGKPPPRVRGRSPDGTPFDVLPGGFHLEPTKPDFRVWKESGSTRAGGSVRSIPELKKLLKRTCREEGVPLEAAQIEAVPSKTRAPPLTFGMSWSKDGYRAIAKMACNFFALRHHDAFAATAFNPVRRFVLSGEGELKAFVQYNVLPVDLAAQPLGELDHLLLVTSQGGAATALVCLFGHLQFLVRLGTHGDTSSSRASYRVDQLGRQYRTDDPSDLALELPDFDAIERVPYEAILDAHEAAMNRLLPIVMQKQDQLFRRSLIDEAVKELARPNGTVSRQAVVDLVIKRYMALVRARPHEDIE